MIRALSAGSLAAVAALARLGSARLGRYLEEAAARHGPCRRENAPGRHLARTSPRPEAGAEAEAARGGGADAELAFSGDAYVNEMG